MSLVVRVLPDVPAVNREFDYVLPDDLVGQHVVAPGTMVRITFSGRRVGGWITEVGVVPDTDRELSEVHKLVGSGPDAEVIELCRWVAWRWAGRLATVMRLATPDRVVPMPGKRSPGHDPGGSVRTNHRSPGEVTTLEMSPTTAPAEIALPLLDDGPTIVVTPSVVAAERLTRELRRAGHKVARWPVDWGLAAQGAHVVGGRSAVFASVPGLRRIAVFDEHDDALQSESSPSWNARDVAVERSRRFGADCLLASPCLSLQARYAPTQPSSGDVPDLPVPAPIERVSVAERRGGWAPVTVVDRRGGDAREGLYSTRLVELARSTARAGGTVLCVLNRTGRAKLLVCRSCGTTAVCADCGSATNANDDSILVCRFCGVSRPLICDECGSQALSMLRVGVSRAREELEALMLEPVAVVTAESDERWRGRRGDARVVIGTTAVLHRVPNADLVAFLDFDQELLALRYRAAEDALGLIVMANRCLGGRSRGGRLVLQTRSPDHEVVQAALRADPSLVADVEGERRSMLGYPPFGTLAVIGGAAAQDMVDRLALPPDVSLHGPEDGEWLLKSPDQASLLDTLHETQRPPGRLRLWVDPYRLR